MDESPWGRPYNVPFELPEDVTAWRLTGIDRYGVTTHLRCLPNPGQWSTRARCHQFGAFHLSPPVPGCGCGWRIVRDIPSALEYWRLRRDLAFTLTHLVRPAEGVALVPVTARGKAMAHDEDANMTNANCLSVEYIGFRAGSTIYTTAAEHAYALERRYRTEVLVVDDFDAIPAGE
ncbi:hypothetical protein VMT65_05695 [Nocardia sp. CDC153]|uniref:hypothetical protein n=1 Tax=Nocardia sp. CDC153 TaxID=3112167 RepID=UPI002DBD1E1D|nr:hypothetical protein [Nocardia sp. CDC153]MEC3952518.1 hypothetical protein [Nocardia sp. CDC153]